MKTLNGYHWTIYVADVMAGLAEIDPGSIHCTTTSPPYWGLRDYGFEGQIGSESTPDLYVSKLVNVFRELKRVLRDDGVLFINIGDTFATGAGSARNPGSRVYGKQNGHVSNNAFPSCQPNRMDIGIDAGNMVGVPWRIAFALQADGWILRSNVIWWKPTKMPESVSGVRWMRCRRKAGDALPGFHGHCEPTWEECSGCDKCRDNDGYVLRRGSWRQTIDYEHIFMFVKSPKYFSDGDSSKDPAVTGSRGSRFDLGKSAAGKHNIRKGERQADNETRNQRAVWRIVAENYKEAHFATYPTELVRRCLISGTSRGGCCSACGNQYAPVVESVRKATRPGTNSKVNRASDDEDSPYEQHSGSIVGNRDPQRHTTTTVVTGYRPTCKCVAEVGRPRVLDPFGGSMTTGQVAINMGCDFIGIEGKMEYAELGVKRLETPWVPISERQKKSGKRRRRHKAQRELF